jgi:hypothetical protein
VCQTDRVQQDIGGGHTWGGFTPWYQQVLVSASLAALGSVGVLAVLVAVALTGSAPPAGGLGGE